jgi:BirA family biotin operon repressor/biotin-[acetyl-CoA-carboxylase] ligase
MTGWPAGFDRVILEEVDSTNAEAARRAPPGRPVWIMARRQTAGRGRRGRGWSDPPGHLAATCLFRPECAPETGALYSFVACLALADLFAALVPEAAISFKWPNDALVNGGKAAGILLESQGRRDRLDWLAVGIGVNLVAAPEGVEIRPGGTPPIALTDAGAPPTAPEDALAILAPAFARWDALFRAEGFAPVRAAWLARAARLGQPIGAGLAGEEVTGIFEDVDTGGRLVLRTPAGRRTIPAADIFFPE